MENFKRKKVTAKSLDGTSYRNRVGHSNIISEKGFQRGGGGVSFLTVSVKFLKKYKASGTGRELGKPQRL